MNQIKTKTIHNGIHKHFHKTNDTTLIPSSFKKRNSNAKSFKRAIIRSADIVSSFGQVIPLCKWYNRILQIMIQSLVRMLTTRHNRCL